MKCVEINGKLVQYISYTAKISAKGFNSYKGHNKEQLS